MPDASVATSAEVEVYANWALIMVRMTHGSVGADPWTVVQTKLHPVVAEPEFTPLNLSSPILPSPMLVAQAVRQAVRIIIGFLFGVASKDVLKGIHKPTLPVYKM
jgi:hypothetical protein